VTSLFFFKFRKALAIFSHSCWRRPFLAHRVAAGVEHLAVLASISPLNTVVDIGANRGQFSLVAANLFPDAAIFAFEPLLAPASVFSRIFSSKPNIALFPVAVGPTSGQSVMHLSRKDDSSSLLPITDLQANIFPGTDSCGSVNVNIRPLSSLLSASDIASPSLLKLDVQGYEYEALLGCEDLIPLFDYIYCECSFLLLYHGQKSAAEVISWLHAKGYSLLGAYNMQYNSRGIAVQCDFLFGRD
jgi:FkbM family methyltransferase